MGLSRSSGSRPAFPDRREPADRPRGKRERSLPSGRSLPEHAHARWLAASETIGAPRRASGEKVPESSSGTARGWSSRRETSSHGPAWSRGSPSGARTSESFDAPDAPSASGTSRSPSPSRFDERPRARLEPSERVPRSVPSDARDARLDRRCNSRPGAPGIGSVRSEPEGSRIKFGNASDGACREGERR